MKSKQSKAALIRLVESGIQDVGNIPSDKLYVLVRDIDVSASPPTDITAFVSIRFLPTGAPFCCGEPFCYSPVFSENGAEELDDYLRRKMNLQHAVHVKLKCEVEYFDGIEFTAFHE
jgi:hypothetical protein